MIQIPPTPLGRAERSKLAAGISREQQPEWRWFRLAVLGSGTTEFLNSYLIVEAARFEIGLEIWNGPYGQIEQQCIDPTSELFRHQPDAVLILPELEDFSPSLAWRYLTLSPEEMELAVGEIDKTFGRVIEAVHLGSGVPILLGNFPMPSWKAAGAAEASLAISLEGILHSLNERLRRRCRSVSNVSLFDIYCTGCEIGWNKWRDRRMAAIARAPHSSEALTGIARLLARQLRSWVVPPKKCLVLDMDNTLWGGVVGEVGLEGISLGPDYPGNAFLDFQRRVIALRDCGILLAAASKNNPDDVETVFSSHPSCLLTRDDFSAFEVHWEDKATSLRRIAETLNIGIDSLVFFDDNPVERQWMREQLPAVTVIEVPGSPLLYVEALENSLAFDTFSLTEEDRNRAVLYRQESARSQVLEGASSLEDFIRSLEMVVTLSLLDDAQMPRIVQLVGKTNQFNLTTRRHSEAELVKLLEAGGFGVVAKARDRFGDSGLVGVAIAVPETDGVWEVDTFLMSCRVIGRGVETALLATLERMVRARGASELFGVYAPTAKNHPAADFYSRHGYENSGTGGRWHICLDETRPLPDSFTVSGPHPDL